MKTSKIAVMLVAVMVSSLLMLTPANAALFPSLPPGQVQFTLTLGPTKWPGTVVFSGISGQAGGPFDVSDGVPYTAWCAQFHKDIVPGDPYMATLISSLGLGTTWNKINYLLNHNTGEDLDMQVAIWLLLGVSSGDIAARYGLDPNYHPADALAMYNAANTAAGAAFVPGTGQLVAVEVVTVGDAQDLIIELTIPSQGGPGLTPGFWKHNVGVYLTSVGVLSGKNSVNGAYSDPTNSPVVSKDTMGDWLASLDSANGGPLNLLALYNDMNLQGGGAAGAATRNNAANVFNALAGLAPL